MTDEKLAQAWLGQWHQFKDAAGRLAWEQALWAKGDASCMMALEMIEQAKFPPLAVPPPQDDGQSQENSRLAQVLDAMARGADWREENA